MSQGDGSLLMRGARIFYRNFQGREGKYNAEGDRNFCLELDQETADQLARDGWPVKKQDPREEGDENQPYIEVRVKYGRVHRPTIYLVTTRGGVRHRRTLLNEDMVDLLDSVEIANVDLIVRPYEWAVGGKTGIKPYLKSLYLTVVEDELEAEYAELDDVPAHDDEDA